MSRRTPAAWSCLVDDTPAIWASLAPWLASLTELGGVPAARIHVHHVCPLPGAVARLLRRLGVATHAVEPFDPRHPHTNKIRQCRTDFGDARTVVLTDVDVAFAAALPIAEIGRPVAGKLVDAPNPPLPVLRRVFGAAGVAPPPSCPAAHVDAAGTYVPFETLPANFNGGLYVVERAALDPLGEAWDRRARWLIRRIDLLERWAVHADQVAFCLAVHDLGLATAALDEAWNFPLHIPMPPDGPEPLALHHHAQLDRALRLRPPQGPRARAAVDRVNAAVDAFQRRHMPIRRLLRRSGRLGGGAQPA